MSETITLNRADLKDSMLVISNLAGNAVALSLKLSTQATPPTLQDFQKLEELMRRIATRADNHYVYFTNTQ